MASPDATVIAALAEATSPVKLGHAAAPTKPAVPSRPALLTTDRVLSLIHTPVLDDAERTTVMAEVLACW
jgi:hypothetical protein